MTAPRLIQAIVSVVAVVTIGTALAPLTSGVTPSPAPAAQTASYLPALPGQQLVYRTRSGDHFSLIYRTPVSVTWFDGTRRELIPVHDTRCDCEVLLGRSGGQVRAMGVLTDGQLHPWGEYIVVLPEVLQGPPQVVETPAGLFRDVLHWESAEGTVWVAPGVGIIKTESYELIRMIGVPQQAAGGDYP